VVRINTRARGSNRVVATAVLTDLVRLGHSSDVAFARVRPGRRRAPGARVLQRYPWQEVPRTPVPEPAFLTMTSRPRVPALLLATLCLTGCSALFQSRPPTPEEVAERALAALARDDHQAAIPDLEWVHTHFPDRPIARDAMLAHAAAELDPANPDRRPDVGTDLLGELRLQEDGPPWLPVTHALHRVALELRATRERADQAETARDRARQAARLAAERGRLAAGEAGRARQEAESLQNRVASLERQLAQSRREAEAMRREVARIRRALGS
jgi:hypothetical protein